MNKTSALPARQVIPASAWIALLFGVFAVSTSAVLIRFAQSEGVPSLVIAAFRLVIATAILTPIVLPRHRGELAALRRRDWLLMATSGVFLALHFATWISSLEYTSVLIATVFVDTHPIWICILEVVFLKARVNRWIVIGLIVCVTGGMIIGVSGSAAGGAGSNPLQGATLALVGAMTVAVYMVIGRSVRSRLSLLPYIYVVYGCAAVTLVVIALASGKSFTGYSANAYLLMLLMALLPQLVGHSSFNFAVKFVPATTIGIVTQTEPVASALLAFVLLSEQPGIVQVLASGLVLVGVAVVVLSPPMATAAEAVEEAETL